MAVFEQIKSLCDKTGTSMYQVEKELSLSRGYINKLKDKNPSAERLEKFADYFNVPVDYLLTGEMPDYYENKESNELAQFLFEHPEHRVLFDASKKIKKEDLEIVLKLLEKFGE